MALLLITHLYFQKSILSHGFPGIPGSNGMPGMPGVPGPQGTLFISITDDVHRCKEVENPFSEIKLKHNYDTNLIASALIPIQPFSSWH